MEFLPAVFAQAEELARIEARQPFAAGWGEDGFAGELKQPCAVIWAARDGQKPSVLFAPATPRMRPKF